MLLGTGLIVATSLAAGSTIAVGVDQKISKSKPALRAAFAATVLVVAAASGKLMVDAKAQPAQATAQTQALIIR